MLLFLADPHIGIHKSNENFYNTMISLFEEIVDVCSLRGIDKIAVLGDFFENRRVISQKSMATAQKVIKICRDIRLILIRGNHDTYYQDSADPNWLTSLGNHDNVTTVEHEPLFLGDYCFVPWGYDVTKIQWDKYLFGHFAISTFLMNDGFACPNGSKPSDYSKFKHVFSGHFHWPSSRNNITYVGSPFQHNFGDCGSPRGYYILDGENVTFTEFTSAPKFYKINTDAFDSEKQQIPGNFIKLIFDKDYGTAKNTKFVEEAERLSPLSIVVDTSKLSKYSEIQTDELVHFDDAEEMFIDFLNRQDIPEHLNKELLVKITHKLWQEE